jgi:hypothetical protein
LGSGLADSNVILITSPTPVSGQNSPIKERIKKERVKGAPKMNSTVLLQKLLAIERSVGVASNSALRNRLQEAQDYVLQMQRERVEGFWKEPGPDAKQRLDISCRAS